MTFKTSSSKSVQVVLFGVGGVGREVLGQILNNRSLYKDHFGLEVNIRAVADSKTIVEANEGGFSDDKIEEIIAAKSSGSALTGLGLSHYPTSSATELLEKLKGSCACVVDCTATDSTTKLLLSAAESGLFVVSANKKPFTDTQEIFDRLMATRCVRHESTVGAGLPVITAMNRLYRSGDMVKTVEGAFSGTLGYVMSGLEDGQSFSEVVAEALKLGYTEPDPRDDLNGMDVARKALILARLTGQKIEMKSITVEGLYPSKMDSMSVDEFMSSGLKSLDADMAKMCSTAAAEGKTLRYVASIDCDSGVCVVGPKAVPKESPIGLLRGTDNIVSAHTKWYYPKPLVIQGRGAGVESTAAGVLADLVDLVYA